MPTIRRWIEEDQRGEPYNNIERVSERSDYDRRVPYQRGWEQEEQDEEYEYYVSDTL